MFDADFVSCCVFSGDVNKQMITLVDFDRIVFEKGKAKNHEWLSIFNSWLRVLFDDNNMFCFFLHTRRVYFSQSTFLKIKY